ncbi:MAG: hypothetical protein Q7T01_02825 [bacterium]|nr:hypothetical protein [bacterium]
MKKMLLGLLLASVLVTVGIATAKALAPPDVEVVIHAVANRSVAAGDVDVVGLDFSILPGDADVLDALSVKQDGSAVWQRDLTAAELWADAGAVGFQGIGVDTKLTDGAWLGSENGWTFDRVLADIPSSGRRFFVTVDVYHSPSDSVTTMLTLPLYRDNARPMQYDSGDRGIFLRTARPAPMASVTAGTLTLARFSADSMAPTARITDPVSGASFHRDWLLVRGVAQDAGGSAVAKVQLSVNRTGKEATWVDAVPEVAGFGTWEARLFGLPRGSTIELRVRAEDWIGNRSAVSEPVVVTLDE